MLYTQAHYSLGAVAQSFTSTTHAPVTENEAAIVDRDILRYRLVKSKGTCVRVSASACMHIIMVMHKLVTLMHTLVPITFIHCIGIVISLSREVLRGVHCDKYVWLCKNLLCSRTNFSL